MIVMMRTFFILLIFAVHSFAFSTLTLDNEMDSLYVTDSVAVFTDEKNTLTVDDFLQNKADLSKAVLLKNISSLKKNTYWLYLEAKNPNDRPMHWTLTIPRTNAGVIEAYHILDGKLVDAQCGNALRPYLMHPYVAYSVETTASSTSKILVKIYFDEIGFLFPQVIVHTHESFERRQMVSTMLKSLTLGGIFIIFVYNLFLLFSLKTRAYFWHCAYMLSAVMFVLAANGLGYEYIWKGSEYLSRYMFAIVYPLFFALALQFSRVFLRTKEGYALIDKLLLTAIYLYILLTAFALFVPSYREYALKIFHVSSLAMCLLPFLGLYAWRNGQKEARWYTLAWSSWAVGLTPVILVVAGANIGIETLENMVRFGLWFEALLLSFALADQINILRSQRDEAIGRYESQREMLELQSRFAQMGEMIAAIGHQWKQPLNALYIAVQDIKDAHRHGELDGKYIDNTVKKSTELIEYMSKTLDDFKRFFSPNKIKREFSLKESIDSVLAMIGAQYKEADMEFEFFGDLDVNIYGMENEFKQVLVNLFNNARDVFIERDTKNRKITIKAHDNEAVLTLEITDNAGGIDEETMDKIFGQYFTTKGEKGTGIGLYICKTVIEKSFGGTITAKNSGGGLQFTITLSKEMLA